MRHLTIIALATLIVSLFWGIRSVTAQSECNFELPTELIGQDWQLTGMSRTKPNGGKQCLVRVSNNEYVWINQSVAEILLFYTGVNYQTSGEVNFFTGEVINDSLVDTEILNPPATFWIVFLNSREDLVMIPGIEDNQGDVYMYNFDLRGWLLITNQDGQTMTFESLSEVVTKYNIFIFVADDMIRPTQYPEIYVN